MSEAVASYRAIGLSSDVEPEGPWPYTIEIRKRRRDALLARRRAALEQMRVFARDTQPDPDGRTVVDYLRELRDPDWDREEKDD